MSAEREMRAIDWGGRVAGGQNITKMATQWEAPPLFLLIPRDHARGATPPVRVEKGYPPLFS